MRSVIADSRRLVVKVGSSLVTNDGRGLDHTAIGRWAAQIAALREQGKEVVLVSSGAIAEGMQRLGWTKRPREIDELQAAAAVGQMGLAQVYESRFAEHSIRTGSVLDDDRLSPHFTQLLRHDAREYVVLAPGRIWHDNPHDAGRILRRPRNAAKRPRQQRHQAEQFQISLQCCLPSLLAIGDLYGTAMNDGSVRPNLERDASHSRF